MNFYFPRSRIFLTAVHKSGSTSVMNFFGALEEYLAANGASVDDVNELSDAELRYREESSDVHTDREIALKFMVEHDFNQTDLAICSVAIVRDPLERFTSFWFNKMVLMRDSTYYEVAKQYFPDVEVTSMGNIREGAKKFLNSTEFANRVKHDAHLQPQTYSVAESRHYDIYVETKELSKMPQKLVESSPQYSFIRNAIFPHNNPTEKELTQSFYDQELVDLLLDIYGDDFNILKSRNMALASDKSHIGGEPDVDILKSINGIRAREIANQMMVAMDVIAAERDAVLNSRIWRISKFYRDLRGTKS